MRPYPSKFPTAAIAFIEPLIAREVEERLVNEGFEWRAEPFLISPDDTARLIGYCDERTMSDDDLGRMAGIAFLRHAPARHLQFVTDGYYLELRREWGEPRIVVAALPATFMSYHEGHGPEIYDAAKQAVQRLIVWRLANFRHGSESLWPIGDYGGADLVYGDLYRMIIRIGNIGYCRTRHVIDFLLASVPELVSQWEAEGLQLVPVYNVGDSSRDRFVTLRLVPKQP